MKDKKQRQLIEDIIRSKSHNKYEDVHNEMYKAFFSIDYDLYVEYNKKNKKNKISVIDFIEKKNMLEVYYQVVIGNIDQAKRDYYSNLKREGEIGKNKIIEQKLKEQHQKQKLEKEKYLEKAKSGQATDFDKLMNSLDE